MTLEQKLRTMPRPEADKLVHNLYSRMAELILPTHTYTLIEFARYARGLLRLWPLKRSRERLQSECEALISSLPQLEGPLHSQNIEKVTKYLSSEIGSAVAFYPGDEKRFGALQQHLQGGLESSVALIEGHENELEENHVRFLFRTSWGYGALGALAGYAVSNVLSGSVGGLTVLGVILGLYGFAAGLAVSLFRGVNYDENVKMRLGEQLKVLEHDASQAFTSPS